jgi:hypothetical protein
VPTQRAVPLYRATRADLHLRPQNLYTPFTSANASAVAIRDRRADEEKRLRE